MKLPNVDIYLRQVEPKTYARVLGDIKSREIYNLIVDTNVQQLPQLLRGILQMQMNEYKYHYLFTTFDLETFDLEDFKYNFVNVTAFRLIDNDDIGVRETLKDMRQFYLREDFKSNFLRHKGRMIEVRRGSSIESLDSCSLSKIIASLLFLLLLLRRPNRESCLTRCTCTRLACKRWTSRIAWSCPTSRRRRRRVVLSWPGKRD